jgi:tetratricopeptide (TPR) repeat protein
MPTFSTEDVFIRAFEPARQAAHALALGGAEATSRSGSQPIVGRWRCLLGASALRAAGLVSEANDFINHAAAGDDREDLLSAEVLTEAGLALKKADRLEDAAGTLDSALAVWLDACSDAVTGAQRQHSAAFAARLRPLLEAADLKPPSTFDEVTASKLAVAWLTERAAPRWSTALYAFAPICVACGQAERARAIIDLVQRWFEGHLTGPMASLTAGDDDDPFRGPHLAPPVREAAYRIQLARGEAELAADEYEASAQAFAAAAGIYEGHAVDARDVVWMLQAKFNQANSLLRLSRWDEALKIYALVEHGFERFATPGALARVQQAILFARMKREEADGG